MDVNVEVEKGHEAEQLPARIVLYNDCRGVTYRPDGWGSRSVAGVAAFGITQNPHLLSLWTEGGSELTDNVTAHVAGIHPNERLLLRPGAVKGGNAR
jgi:hypothetical protein